MSRRIDVIGMASAVSMNVARTPEPLSHKRLTMPFRKRCCWQLGIPLALAITGAMTAFEKCAFAQIAPDTTLGNERSRVTPNVNVRGLPADLIQGGAIRGANLFQSFEQFNVGDGQRVYFANPVGIENILSRVTGNNRSNILGTLGVDGGANLFLLNPNGIIFGQNAKLDIAGSFVASTANSVVFNNGYLFSAKNPDAPPLLTVNVPLGVQYGTNQSRATIANSGNLAVGQNLTLSAGNLDLQGQVQAGGDLTLFAQDTVRVRDSVVNPFIASADGNLLVQGNQKVDIFALNHPDSGLFSGGNMVLRSANTVGGDAHYWSGGSFRIEKLDGSLGDLSSPYDPIIRSLGDVSFFAYQGTSLHILAGGEVNIGTIVITGAETGVTGVDYLQQNVPLSNGKEVSINGSLQPTLDIRAGVAPAFIGVPGVTGFNPATDIFLGQRSVTGVPTSANITIGDVVIVPPKGLVFITNQYQPNTALPGGDINVTGVGLLGFGIFAPGSMGNGGSVILDSRRNIAITNSGISSSSDFGNSGDITLLANDTVSLNNSSVFSDTFGAGKGGDIYIQARKLLVTNGAHVAVNTTGEGKGGSLIVNASQAVQILGTSVDGQFPSGVYATATGSGDGGNVQITTPALLVTDGGVVNANTYSEGRGGSLTINASQVVQILGTSVDGQFRSSLLTQSLGKGDGGNIKITTPALLVIDGAEVSASTTGEGKGGSLMINASQGVQLMGTSADGQFASSLFAQTLGKRDGGNVEINTPRLLVADGAQVNVSTYGEGQGGNLIVNASQGMQLMGISANGQSHSTLASATEGKGNGGNVEITTPELLVSDGAQVNVSTAGEGEGGNLIVNASQGVQLMGISANGQSPTGLFATTFSKADGGNVEINTPGLLVTNGAQVNVSAFGEGKGGSLIVNASQGVQLLGTSANGLLPSALFATTRGRGNGGNVEINTPELLVTDGAQANVSTFGEGEGGSLIVNASQGVQLLGTSADGLLPSALFAATSGKGIGGHVEINTPELLVTDGAQANVSTFGEGKGGSLIVNASQGVQLLSTSADGLFPSGLFAFTAGTGAGGNVYITTPGLLVQDGAVVSAKTYGEGKGGDLIVNASEEVRLSGAGGLAVNATAGGTAGDLTIKTNKMFVTDGAEVSVSSPQGQAGNLNITANSLTLNRGTISAVTGTSGAEGGANITLKGLDLLRMDNESLISASALNNANGGNVTIDSTFIVATPPTGPEGSDIIANAEQGNGGRVNVTTQGLFGIQFRPQRTPKNDITVSSTFGLSGEYVLNTPGVDPSRGLAELPTEVVDASQQIDRRCTPQSTNRGSSFTITGRGGIPPSPNEPIQGESVNTPNWVTLNSEKENNTPPTPATPRNSAPKQLVEAQGWRINEQGQVVLTASAPKATLQSTWLASPECHPAQSATKPEP